MLVLTRKPGEGLTIGDDICIKIIEVKGGAVRIGIDAPKDTKIYRQELIEKVTRENKAAARWELESLDDLDALSTMILSKKQVK